MADLPDVFEAWWATHPHRNRELADYNVKKAIAFSAFHYGVSLEAPAPADKLLPEIPTIEILKIIALEEWPADWEVGKAMQVQGADIPGNTELEIAAGQWRRLREHLLKRNDPPPA